MSWKSLFLIILIVVLGAFIYLKIQTLGNPDSHFNQTTRISMGEHPLMRTILGLHSVGDARAEYLEGTGPITIEWFAPQEENIDPKILQQFATLVNKYTGRTTQVVFAGNIDDGTIALADLNSFKLKAGTQASQSGGSQLLVFFTEDYSPRPDNEISTTYQETAMAISLTAHRQFLQDYVQDLNQYLLASMLHEFGNQIGMQETQTGPSDCIMNLHASLNGQPLESFGQAEPQDFCPSEQQEIDNIKQQLQLLN